MRICVNPLAEWTRDEARRHLFARRAVGELTLIFAVIGLLSSQTPAWSGTLSAQTSRPQAPISFSAQKSDQAQKDSTNAQPVPAATPAGTPATLPAPAWPADSTPAAASVVWDGHTLRIVASNSSLAQILKDVSAATGANLQGMGEDQRVFGDYGPGTARDVLSQLLDGSGYNILIIGDRGQGTPRRIVLSARPASGAQPTAAANQPQQNDADSDADQQPQEPQPEEPPPPPPVQTSPTPVPAHPIGDIMQQQRQLMMQQLQQQQQQMQQQQQQNPQN